MKGSVSSFLSGLFGKQGARLSSAPRTVDEIECICSVLLAILFAHLVGARNVSWAAFSGYMVMRNRLSESMVRGALRIVGTGAGAVVAMALVPIVVNSTALASITGAVVGGLSLYGALTGRHAYAWLFVGLTFEMVLLDSLEHLDRPVRAFAETRLIEVTAGTIACLVINVISQATARRRWPMAGTPALKLPEGWNPYAARLAGQAAMTLGLIPWLGHWVHVPELSQSAVTVMVVMLVPISGKDDGSLASVRNRVLQRLVGCAAGGALAAGVLVTARGDPAALISGTALGVLIGRHIENGRRRLAYVGTQFTLAVLVTLVPDSYAAAAAAPGWHRLIGILIGIGLLEPVLLVWRFFEPGRSRNGRR